MKISSRGSFVRWFVRREPRRIAGRNFVRLTLSFALGFVRVIFPRAIAVGFSLCGLTAASEMSAAPAEVRAAIR